jgi:predicted HicB family RNase H-like nuclease
MTIRKRPSGRPPLDAADPSVAITVRIPAKQLEAADDRAKVERITLPEWIRRTLRLAAARDK